MLRGRIATECWVRLRLRFPDGHLSSADTFFLLLAGLACVLHPQQSILTDSVLQGIRKPREPTSTKGCIILQMSISIIENTSIHISPKHLYRCTVNCVLPSGLTSTSFWHMSCTLTVQLTMYSGVEQSLCFISSHW